MKPVDNGQGHQGNSINLTGFSPDLQEKRMKISSSEQKCHEPEHTASDSSHIFHPSV